MKIKVSILLCFVLAFCLLGCNEKSEEKKGNINVYYISTETMDLVTMDYDLQTDATENQVIELFELMKQSQNNMKLTSSVPQDLKLEKQVLTDGQLNLHFNKSYHDINSGTEILMRAAIVKTMIQLADVNFVSIYVGDDALTDSNGNPIGIMNDESFVQNVSSNLYNYQTTSLKLYFSNKEGNALVPVEIKNIKYYANVSIEKLVVEQLMKGPNSDSVNATIPSGTKLIGISLKDGVCYVNLSSSFLINSFNQSPEVTIYSIVNSLIENTKVLKVQILIDGKTDATYLNTMDLSQPFEWNGNLFEQESET